MTPNRTGARATTPDDMETPARVPSCGVRDRAFRCFASNLVRVPPAEVVITPCYGNA